MLLAQTPEKGFSDYIRLLQARHLRLRNTDLVFTPKSCCPIGAAAQKQGRHKRRPPYLINRTIVPGVDHHILLTVRSITFINGPFFCSNNINAGVLFREFKTQSCRTSWYKRLRLCAFVLAGDFLQFHQIHKFQVLSFAHWNIPKVSKIGRIRVIQVRC